jgi:hypothetical protein
LQIVRLGTTQVDNTTHPLTHHEILGLIEPFTRSGRQVDLSKSDRIKRCLVFKPVEHASENSLLAGARETVQLDNPRSGLYRLTRDLTLPSGLKATLQTEGPHPRDLLARIETVPPKRQFRSESGTIIALSYRLAPIAGAMRDGVLPMRMVFTRGEAHVEGLTVILNDRSISDHPVDIDLVPEAGYSFELPEDLLAVLGSDWGLMRRRRVGWSSSLRVRGSAFDRSRQVEIKLEKLVAHLTATLAKPPPQFHETLLRARWGVVFRRAIPLLIFLALIAGAGGLSFVEIPEASVVRLLSVAAPTVLLFSAFTMRDRPPIEFPSLPRRSRATTWRHPPVVHQAQ